VIETLYPQTLNFIVLKEIVMEITNNTTMPFSLYELYKETVEGKVSTNHSQLIKSFKTALSNLTEEEQSTILWDEKTFQLPR